MSDGGAISDPREFADRFLIGESGTSDGLLIEASQHIYTLLAENERLWEALRDAQGWLTMPQGPMPESARQTIENALAAVPEERR